MEMEIDQLQEKITIAINAIRNGESSPKESGIGKLLAALKSINLPEYLRRFDEYRPVFEADRKKRGSKKLWYTQEELDDQRERRRQRDRDLEEEVEREVAAIAADLDMPMEGFDDDEPQPKEKKRKTVSAPRLTTDQQAKLNKRKENVKYIPEKQETPDQLKFILDGEEFAKGPLVLAVIKKYVGSHPGLTHDQLKAVFPDHLVKGYGAFAKYEFALEKSKGRKRYFLNDHQLIRLQDTVVAVCNQITGENVRLVMIAAAKVGIMIK